MLPWGQHPSTSSFLSSSTDSRAPQGWPFPGSFPAAYQYSACQTTSEPKSDGSPCSLVIYLFRGKQQGAWQYPASSTCSRSSRRSAQMGTVGRWLEVTPRAMPTSEPLGHSQAEQSTAPIGAAQGHLQRVSQLCGPYWYWRDAGTIGPMGSSCCPPW